MIAQLLSTLLKSDIRCIIDVGNPPHSLLGLDYMKNDIKNDMRMIETVSTEGSAVTKAPAILLGDIARALALQDAVGQEPLPLSPDFSDVISKARSVFTVAEIADIAGVKDRQVHHWATGTHSPQGATRDRVLQLFQIVASLETQMESNRVKVWMWTPQAELGDSPVGCLKAGEGPRVIAAARALEMRDEASDSALVQLARSGNTSAYDTLVRRYRGFAHRKASLYSSSENVKADLVQEGLLGLYKAIRDFRGDRGQDFRFFAESCMARQVLSAVISTEEQTDGEDWIPLYPVSGRGKLSDDNGADIRAELELEGSLTFVDFLENLMAETLSESQRKPVSLYLDGLDHDQIAAELDCDREEVQRALKEAKQRLGQAIVLRNQLVHSGSPDALGDHADRATS